MIEITEVSKSFKKVQVLSGVSVSFTPGKITSIVGPNGSGKSTLIKSILGLVSPDSGSISVMGKSIKADFSYRKHIGYMPQIARFPENLTGREILLMVCDIRNIIPAAIDEMSRLFRITGSLEKPFRVLSGGMKQKVSAIAAFLPDPPILILDEPTAGLDPLSSSIFKDFIAGEAKSGKAVILTSHIMSEVEELSENIVFLNEGKVQYRGGLPELLDMHTEKTLERTLGAMMKGNDEIL